MPGMGRTLTFITAALWYNHASDSVAEIFRVLDGFRSGKKRWALLIFFSSQARESVAAAGLERCLPSWERRQVGGLGRAARVAGKECMWRGGKECVWVG